MHGAFIVSWDFSNGKDKEVLLVGEKKEGRIDIVNAFQGEEAVEIYKKLWKSTRSWLLLSLRRENNYAKRRTRNYGGY